MKDRKVPMRRCVGCMVSKEKKDLVRIACYEGNLSVDLTGRAKAEEHICVETTAAAGKRRIRRKLLNAVWACR